MDKEGKDEGMKKRKKKRIYKSKQVEKLEEICNTECMGTKVIEDLNEDHTTGSESSKKIKRMHNNHDKNMSKKNKPNRV